MENFNDTFLAQWIAGDASAEEIAAFKNHPEFDEYLKIREASNQLSFGDFDENKAYDKLKEELLSSSSKVKPLYKWLAGIAACTLLFFGFLQFNNKSTTYNSTIAEQQVIELPDGSKMTLNASAEAKVDTKNWQVNREVFLKGEAFFKVEKGEKFTVKTKLGTVQVLGTQFSVNTINDKLIIVKCFEGKVKVTSEVGEVLLTKGMAFQDYKNTIERWNFHESSPNWLTSKQTTLHKVSVQEVITLLKRHYNLDIKNQVSINTELLFTGSFSNTNLKKALYSVFGVLGVEYELISDNEIRILTH